MIDLYNHKCKLCPLYKGAKTVCMEGSGKTEYHAMVIGEAPGRNEDNTGKPFVGNAGKLLDSALAFSFRDDQVRKEVFVTNVVKCRPPQNAKPTNAQMTACFEYLYAEILEVDPVAILALGNSAIEVLLDKSGVFSLRGKWQKLERERTTWVMPTFHPSFVLRRGGYDSQEYTEFCKDVDLFAGKIKAYIGKGHPDDAKPIRSKI